MPRDYMGPVLGAPGTADIGRRLSDAGELRPPTVHQDSSPVFSPADSPAGSAVSSSCSPHSSGCFGGADKWLDGWRYAAGLYVAHQATLYLRTYAVSSPDGAHAAATGAAFLPLFPLLLIAASTS